MHRTTRCHLCRTTTTFLLLAAAAACEDMVDVIPIVSSGCVVSLQPDGAEVAIGERETFIAVLDHCSEAEAMPRTFQWQIRGNGSAVMTVSVSDSAITLEGLAPGTATVFARWSADPNSADASSFTVRP